jgi:5,10-methylenetetrahydromethanopterin reductase
VRIGAWLDAGMSATDVIDVCRRLEAGADGGDELPVASVWLSEAYIGRDAVALAAGLAQATERITIATAIINPFTRDRAVLAMTALTLNELAPGRFVLGIGTGELHWMTALGHPFSRPLSAMRDAGREIRAIVAGHPVEAGGERVQIIIRNPDRTLRLYLAAIGPRMCALAGAEYEGCILPAATRELVTAAVADVRSGEAEAGRPQGASETVATLLFAAGDDPDAIRPGLRRKLGLLLTAPTSRSLLERAGLDPAMADVFHANIAKLGLRDAIARLDEELVLAFTISGTLADCRRQLEGFAATGLDVAALLCERDQVDNLLALARLPEVA